MDRDNRILRIIAPKVLRYLADVLERGDSPCELTDSEVKDIYGKITEGMNNKPLSMQSAAKEMGISTATFRAKVAKGELPKGKHDLGFKELRWYRRDLKRYAGKNEN